MNIKKWFSFWKKDEVKVDVLSKKIVKFFEDNKDLFVIVPRKSLSKGDYYKFSISYTDSIYDEVWYLGKCKKLNKDSSGRLYEFNGKHFKNQFGVIAELQKLKAIKIKRQKGE